MTKDKSIDNELIDNLLKNYKKPEDLIGENGLLKQLTKQLLERAMAAELTEHVGYDKHDAAGNNSGNSRNGKSAKTIKGTFGEIALETPRDRNGTFERGCKRFCVNGHRQPTELGLAGRKDDQRQKHRQ